MFWWKACAAFSTDTGCIFGREINGSRLLFWRRCSANKLQPGCSQMIESNIVCNYVIRSCTEAVSIYLCSCMILYWCYRKVQETRARLLMISIWIPSVSGLTEPWGGTPFCCPRKYTRKACDENIRKVFLKKPFIPGRFGANDVFCLGSLTLVQTFS